jgi:hypothetical protein
MKITLVELRMLKYLLQETIGELGSFNSMLSGLCLRH